jgi:hypothetical protein
MSWEKDVAFADTTIALFSLGGRARAAP